MKIVYGPHALDTLVDRAIEPDWVERTLAAPDSIEPDPNIRTACGPTAPCPSATGGCCAWYTCRRLTAPAS
ncbi:hypothetical protein [Methylorubrum sp. SB2]|uniref:hypothetical protein n=1 Tax=Methylorubrum subtropicum TaxID=3138812 RepID=UPI00313E90D2